MVSYVFCVFHAPCCSVAEYSLQYAAVGLARGIVLPESCYSSA
jgi:hypothetical protein